MPTREELTLAWGDRILPGLRPAVKIYVASGRFLASSEEAAVFAVPDKGLLTRALTGLSELESALSSHFGRNIPLKLVLDESPGSGDGGGVSISTGPVDRGAAAGGNAVAEPGSGSVPASGPGMGEGAGPGMGEGAGPDLNTPARSTPARIAPARSTPAGNGRGGASSPSSYDTDPEIEDFDLSELEDAPGAVLSPEQRLLEAFPGAEEVE
jgi:hypothetical protein